MQFVVSGFLLRYTGYQRTLTYDASTLPDALAALFTAHPALRPVVVDDSHTVRRTVRICLDGEVLPPTTIQDTALSSGSTVELLTAVAGG